MLVMSRKVHEKVIIDGNIEVMIVEVRGDKVRLGITAPKEISVHREEVHKVIEAEKQRQLTGEEP